MSGVAEGATPGSGGAGERSKRLALVASKGTLDQAYPPLILATTAASLGWEVGIYFTFYGLDILHQERFEKLRVASLANPAGPIKVPNLLGAVPGAVPGVVPWGYDPDTSSCLHLHHPRLHPPPHHHRIAIETQVSIHGTFIRNTKMTKWGWV